MFYSNRGLAHQENKEYSQALADFTTAIRLATDNDEYYAYRGELYADRDCVNDAKADFEKAIALNPNNIVSFAYYTLFTRKPF